MTPRKVPTDELVDSVTDYMATKVCGELLRYFQLPGTHSLLVNDCRVFDTAVQLRDLLKQSKQPPNPFKR